MAFKSLLPPSIKRPRTEQAAIPALQTLQEVLTQTFSLTTVLLTGGLIQGTLLLLIPRVWVLLPTFLVLLGRFANTMAITFKIIPNPQMAGAILHKTTTVIPDQEGEINNPAGHPSNEKVGVFLLSLRINHPLGYLAPGMKEIGAFTAKMSEILSQEAPDNGFLGQTQFTRTTEQGSPEVLLLSYWRGVEDVLAFSVSPSHKETWAWWESHATDLKHIGISHEVFQADRGMYETLYVNFQPTRLGATSYFRKGDELIGGTVPDAWVSGLVDASKGKLRTGAGRLGWVPQSMQKGKAGRDDEKTDSN